MLSEFALSIAAGPVGVMLIGAVACAIYALRALRPAMIPRDQDALAGLFKRDTFHSQMREAALLNANIRSPRVKARTSASSETRSRDEMLHQIAAVMRGAERDATHVQETARYLAGEGFIIVHDITPRSAAREEAEIIPIGDYEEVKLLPPPSAKASQAKAA